MLNNIKIAISGKSGCGNTTVSKKIAKKLKIEVINYTFRTMEDEKGVSYNEIRRLAELDDSYDIYLDNKQVELASKGSCVLGSRLAIWMLKEADIKIYLSASVEIRGTRIAIRENADIEETILETRDRDRKDSHRYKRIYGIDTSDFSFADLIIDVEAHNEKETIDIILKAVESLH